MIRASRCRVDKAASNARNEEGIVNLKLNGVLERLVRGGKHVVKLLSLANRSREAIKNKATRVLLVMPSSHTLLV